MSEEAEQEGMYGQLYGGRGEDELGPGVFTIEEQLVPGPGKGFKVEGIGHGWRCLFSDRKRDGREDIYRGREAVRMKAVGYMKDVGGNVREGHRNGGSVWLRDWGRLRGEETCLCTRE